MLRVMKERRERRGGGDDLVGVDNYPLETCIVHMAILILTLSVSTPEFTLFVIKAVGTTYCSQNRALWTSA